MHKDLKIKGIEYSIEPKGLSLIVTYKCTAACTSCCFQCTPKKEGSMSVESAKKYIKNAIDSFKSLNLLVITGGGRFNSQMRQTMLLN